MMTDPFSAAFFSGSVVSIRFPSILRFPAIPKFDIRIAPTVYSFPLHSIIREAEPMPPFRPMQHIPVPAPTAPSSKVSEVFSNASKTCFSSTCIPRISLISPSLHSVTTQLTVPVETPISSLEASMYFTDAFSAVPTEKVLVMIIGDSIVPSSSI